MITSDKYLRVSQLDIQQPTEGQPFRATALIKRIYGIKSTAEDTHFLEFKNEFQLFMQFRPVRLGKFTVEAGAKVSGVRADTVEFSAKALQVARALHEFGVKTFRDFAMTSGYYYPDLNSDIRDSQLFVYLSMQNSFLSPPDFDGKGFL